MTQRPIQPSRSVSLLNTAMTIATVVLALATVVALPLAVFVATGHGTLAIDAVLDEPSILELFDGRRVSINDQGVSLFENFPIGEENATIRDVPPVELSVKVQRNDIDTRFIAFVSITGLLAATWIGLLSLRRVVRSAVDGQPFTDENPRRLRFVAWSILAVLAIEFLRAWLINASLESAIAVNVSVGATSRWILVLAAVGFFALAWIFSEAVRLRRFEEATI